MIIVTGAYGFIGSCMVQHLHEQGYHHIVAVDDFSRDDKTQNLADKPNLTRIGRDGFEAWFAQHAPEVEAVFHLGARTDTIEPQYQVFEVLNVAFSQMIWHICTEYQIPMIYASSAATYGAGEQGFEDSTHPTLLQPLNPYGISKNEFDKWVLQQANTPPFWAGLKFFNVYGPNEYHKGRMASVMWHFFRQIRDTGKVRLFESYREGIAHGEQMRDFVHVFDVIRVMQFLFEKREHVSSGIFNLGTGEARSYNDLARAMFAAMQLPEHIEYIAMPNDLREQYQYFTEADMSRLRSAGYSHPFTSLEAGTADYVQRFLLPSCYF